MTEDNIRYEVNHSGEIVQHNSALCKDMDSMILNLFSQYGWHSEIVELKGSYLKLLLKNPVGTETYLNVFKGTIRNEKRNPYEKKIQITNTITPLDFDKKNTIILGVYVFEKDDDLKDAIFISYPIKNDIDYTAVNSLRGVRTNKIILNAKQKGFVYDKTLNHIGFRPEFVFYYLDNFYDLHYRTQVLGEISSTENIKELTPEWFREQAKNYAEIEDDSKQIREVFINKFGLNKLKELSGVDLLNKIFLNGNKDNLCHEIEYNAKSIEYFGDVRGNNSYKYGLYYKNQWRAGTRFNPQILTEEEAIEHGTKIYNYIMQGADILALYENKKLTLDDYKNINNELNPIINNLHQINGLSDVWIFKYYQMIFPQIIPTFYSDKWINNILELLNKTSTGDRIVDMGQISMFINECGISNTVFGRICYDFMEEAEENIQDRIDDEDDFESDYSHNRIVFGAPGTGKSFKLKDEQKILLENGGYVERVTFHPDYSYASFVGTYKPVPDIDKDGNECITYKYVPGPFMRTLAKALKNKKEAIQKPHLLIIEEINRANMAAVFGDIFQLLDRDKNGYSEYPIQTSEDIKKYLSSELGGDPNEYSKLQIPNNMFVWSTMNSADQGVYPMDTAFKRRWDFEYISIDKNEEGIEFKNVKLYGKDDNRKLNWNDLRHEINNKLSSLKINEDKLLGPYFISKNILDIDDDKIFQTAFKNKVLMYLFEDAAKQYRAKLFSIETTKFSDICNKFDDQGVNVFHSDITSKIKSIEEISTEDSK